jgi:hypothetical protein
MQVSIVIFGSRFLLLEVAIPMEIYPRPTDKQKNKMAANMAADKSHIGRYLVFCLSIGLGIISVGIITL